MKFSAAIRKRWPAAALAVLFWLVIGRLGGGMLATTWRELEADRLQRALRTAADLIRGDEWQTPWESDPKWQAFEERLGADIVPQPIDSPRESAPRMIRPMDQSGLDRRPVRGVSRSRSRFVLPPHPFAFCAARGQSLHGRLNAYGGYAGRFSVQHQLEPFSSPRA
ncbi:MAG: hypothetical protein U0892_01230 [Pirellulales bacterium]